MAKPNFDHFQVGYQVLDANRHVIHGGSYWMDDDTERRAFGQRCYEAIRDGFAVKTWRIVKISPDSDVRLWDTQWMSIVNHDNCYRDWSKDDAIAHAVKMTEEAIARNVADGKLPKARTSSAHRPIEGGRVDSWEPSNDEVNAWRDRNDLDMHSLNECRRAIDDARSMHKLAAPTLAGKEA